MMDMMTVKAISIIKYYDNNQVDDNNGSDKNPLTTFFLQSQFDRQIKKAKEDWGFI